MKKVYRDKDIQMAMQIAAAILIICFIVSRFWWGQYDKDNNHIQFDCTAGLDHSADGLIKFDESSAQSWADGKG